MLSRPAGLVSRLRSPSIGSTMAVDDIASPAPSTIAPDQRETGRMRKHRQCRAADHDLRRAQAEHRTPHHPQTLRPHFQSDEEQQHHHTQAGDRGDRIDVGDQAQSAGANGDAGEQIAEYAAEARTSGQRHRDRGSGKQQDESGQHAWPGSVIGNALSLGSPVIAEQRGRQRGNAAISITPGAHNWSRIAASLHCLQSRWRPRSSQ